MSRPCTRRDTPALLSDLTGPQHGVVELPPHVVWSGLRAFGLDRPRLDLRLALRPTLHTLIGRGVREVWENAFPEICGSLDGSGTSHQVIAAPQHPTARS